MWKIVVIFMLMNCANCKRLPRCGVVKKLINNNYELAFLSNWVCLIEAESNRMTNLKKMNEDGSFGYGLFQISNRRWCSSGYQKGGECNMACEDFLNEDLIDDIKCAKKIHHHEGFEGWETWKESCTNATQLPKVHHCPEYRKKIKEKSMDSESLVLHNGGARLSAFCLLFIVAVNGCL